jgi:hypothetical protein
MTMYAISRTAFAVLQPVEVAAEHDPTANLQNAETMNLTYQVFSS